MASTTGFAPLPTPSDGIAVVKRFFVTLAALTAEFSDKDLSLTWIGIASLEVSEYVNERLNVEDLEGDYGISDEGDRLALSVLFREMVYFNRLYAGLVAHRIFSVPDDDQQLYEFVAPAPPEMIGDEAFERAETIIGSIDKVIEALPKWLQKLLHVAQELLKLARLGS